MSGDFDLTVDELRAVTEFAVRCAEPALVIFERDRSADRRPRGALEAAQAFAGGSTRTQHIRDTAWAAQRAFHEARAAEMPAAAEAARATMAAASAPYLHPLRQASQVLHILGAAAHTAKAIEVDGESSADYLGFALTAADAIVLDVLCRYPYAPEGRGRVGEIARALDGRLRDGENRRQNVRKQRKQGTQYT